MNKTEIITVLKDWNFWEGDPDFGIWRDDYVKQVRSLLETNFVISISGVRRAGKSYVLRQVAKDVISGGVDPRRILIINLEDPRLPPLDAQQLFRIFDVYVETFPSLSGPPLVLLDEIQVVRGWQKWVRQMHELKKAKIIVSGSNSKLLGSDISTVLTGRHIDITVFPLSFAEYIQFSRASMEADAFGHSNAEVAGALQEYFRFGSFPEVALSKIKREILLTYFDDIIMRDLVRRFRIRKHAEIKSLAGFYLNNSACQMSFNRAAKYLDLTVSTVKKFSDYLEQSYLLLFLKRFSYKFREVEKSPRKVHSIDTGLSNVIAPRILENTSRLAENCVFLALKRLQSIDRNFGLYYWKDERDREVDFLTIKGGKVANLIQVCWNPYGSPDTKKREVTGILAATAKFGLNKALILTGEHEGSEKVRHVAIKYYPVWKWLLRPFG